MLKRTFGWKPFSRKTLAEALPGTPDEGPPLRLSAEELSKPVFAEDGPFSLFMAWVWLCSAAVEQATIQPAKAGWPGPGIRLDQGELAVDFQGSELSDEWRMEASAVGEMISRLEEGGLIVSRRKSGGLTILKMRQDERGVYW